jgi:hypothetical protein
MPEVSGTADPSLLLGGGDNASASATAPPPDTMDLSSQVDDHELSALWGMNPKE